MTKKFRKRPDKTKFSARVDQNGKQGIMSSLIKVNREISEGLSNFRMTSRFFDQALLNVLSQLWLTKSLFIVFLSK